VADDRFLRIAKGAGWVDPKDLPKGPNGRLCGTDTLADLRPKMASGAYVGTHHKLSRFDMDHVVPVVEGGGVCGLENLRTLCRPCHRLETAALAKRRAEARKQQKSA
jgi:5-methylcytosine-specific restriction endonuclease McrA